jgi:hypothetical protein
MCFVSLCVLLGFVICVFESCKFPCLVFYELFWSVQLIVICFMCFNLTSEMNTSCHKYLLQQYNVIALYVFCEYCVAPRFFISLLSFWILCHLNMCINWNFFINGNPVKQKLEFCVQVLWSNYVTIVINEKHNQRCWFSIEANPWKFLWVSQH